jgi:HEAT repeat protein
MQRFLKIEAGESRLVALLFAEIFLLGIGFNFVETAVFPLFLSEFDAGTLPYLYIINALVVSLLTGAYLRLGRRLSFTRQLLVLHLFLALLPLAFWLAVTFGGRAAVFALPILFQTVISMGQIGFWTMTARLLDLRQSKRLLGVIGSGLWVAIVLTGFLIPLIVRRIGAANLLLIAAVGLAAALALLLPITRRYRAELEIADRPAAGPATRTSDRALRDPYVWLMFGLTIVAWLSFFFIDNIFFNRAGAQFPTQEALSSFMGLYLAALGIFTLFINLFVVGAVINRFGVRVGLFVLPVSLTIVTLAFNAVGIAWGVVPALFWLATLNRVLDLGLLFSVDQSAQTILYQPLPAADRARIQTIDSGIVRMTAVGLAGGLLILLNQVLAADVVRIAAVLLVILLAWLAVAWLTARAYPRRLMAALAHRRLSGVALDLEDSATLGVLLDALHSPRAGSVLYALGLLAQNRPEALAGALPGLLSHPAEQVRREALRWVEALRPADTAARVRQVAESDPDPQVRGAAWRALPAVGGVDDEAAVIAHLGRPNAANEDALIGLRRHGRDAGQQAAEEALRDWAASPDPALRRAAARVMAESFAPADCPTLAAMLGDADPGVRREALLVAGRVACRDWWPAVVAAVADRGSRQAALGALSAGGEAALPAIAAALSAGPAGEIRVVLLRAAARIGGPAATRLLLEDVGHANDAVRTEAANGLVQLGYRAAAGPEMETIRRQIAAEVEYAAWLLAGWRDCGTEIGLDYLRRVLNDQYDETRRRVFQQVALVADPTAIGQAQESLLPRRGQRVDAARRAYALELLELRLPSDLKSAVMPLVEDGPVAARRQQGGVMAAQPALTPVKRLTALAAGNGWQNAWLQVSQVHAAGQIRCSDPDYHALLSYYEQSDDPVLRETAIWTRARIAQQAAAPTGCGEKPMLTTIERVIILKDVELFAETPDELLAEVAGLLTEVELSPGQPVFAKGDAGDSLYVVVSGRMRVHDGDVTISALSESEVFGEMALLDTETRLASVTATEDTLLLRLDQESFYELMDTRSEVARGIIRVLTARLRERVREIAALRGVTPASA